MIKENKVVDLNTILKVVNLSLLGVLCYFFFQNESSLYVNSVTLILGILLSFEIALFLFLEKKKRDPFVLLLCLQMVIYFLFRIVTLYKYSFSVVFLRYPFSVSDLNYSLFFILIANVAFYLGISINNIKPKPQNEMLKFLPRKGKIILIPLALGYFFSFYQQIGLVSLAGIIDVLNGTFLNIAIIIFMVLIYFFLFQKKLKSTVKKVIIFGVLFFIIMQTMIGSRSAILTALNFIIFSILAINDFVVVKRKYLFFTLFLAPVMILFFAVSTFLRPRVENRGVISSETVEVLKEFDLSNFSETFDIVLMNISDRIGFLDYCAEIISNNEEYSSVFNFGFYSKSIIDNVLSPGFDVFDNPKASNALRFIYNADGIPKKSTVADAYQSDEFTFYGECYALFGKWFSLIPIFFTGFLFKTFYLSLNKNNIYLFYLKRGLILYVFYTMLNSFGLDWLCLDIFSIFFTYHIFKRFFKVNNLEEVPIISDI